jgi:hypothetical protein
MFGISTFSQTTYAGLGTNAFQLSLEENVTLTENLVDQSTFPVSVTHGFFIDDQDGTEQDLFFSVDERVSVGMAETTQSSFIQNTFENITSSTAPLIAAQFSLERLENSVLTDNLVSYFAALETRVEPISPVLQNSSGTVGVLVGLTENSSFLDTQQVSAQFIQTNDESIITEDVSFNLVEFFESAIEALALEDTQNLFFVITVSLVEGMGSEDSLLISAGFNQAVGEPLQIIDSRSISADFRPSIVEAFSVLDSQVTRGWFKINDNQSPNWNGINSTQTIIWSQVNDAQLPNWVDIDNTQG